MPVRSIIDIDLNDARFQRFQQLFERYQNQLAKTPSHWSNGNKELEKFRTGFDRVAAAMLAERRLDHGMLTDTKQLERHLTHIESLWKDIGHSSKGVTHSIVTATRSLLKWSSLVTGATGLLGMGGLFGIDRLAGAVSSQRQQAFGLGSTIGQVQAFRVDMGRFVQSPDAFLSQVGALETTPSGWSVFQRMGIQRTGNAALDAVSLMRALHARAEATPISQLSLLSQQTGFNMSEESWRQLRAYSNQELLGQAAAFSRDAARFNTNPATNLAWQKLSTQFERSWNSVLDAFQKRLGSLAPDIAKLSGAFTTLALKVINSPFSRDVIDELGVGIKDLSGWLGSKQFDALAKKLEIYALEVAHTFETIAKALIADTPGIVHTLGVIAHPLDSLGHFFHGGPDEELGTVPVRGGIPPGTVTRATSIPAGPWTKSSALSYLAALDQRYHLPAGTMERVWKTEASDQFHPKTSSAGAVGPFQIMPKNFKAWGIDPNDFGQSADAAAEHIAHLQARFGGDIAPALAGYNEDPNKVAAARAKWGAAWESHLAPGVPAYMMDTLPADSKELPVLRQILAELRKINSAKPAPLARIRPHTTPGADYAAASNQISGPMS